MSLSQWLIALPIWGAGVSAVPIIGTISGWPIWLLAIVSAVVAFLWLTIVTWVVRLYRPAARQETEPIQIANATCNSAAATGSGTAVNALGAGQVIGRIEARRDVIINPLSSMMTPPDERHFVDVTPDDLIGFFRDDQTSIQSNRAVEPFIGKWMKVEGDLGEVLSSFGSDSAQVTFATSIFTGEWGRFKGFYMIFKDKKWVERLYCLTKGTHIAVQGQIDRVDKLSVQLNNCELIR
jgi:hypothetical protein